MWGLAKVIKSWRQAVALCEERITLEQPYTGMTQRNIVLLFVLKLGLLADAPGQQRPPETQTPLSRRRTVMGRRSFLCENNGEVMKLDTTSSPIPTLPHPHPPPSPAPGDWGHGA